MDAHSGIPSRRPHHLGFNLFGALRYQSDDQASGSPHRPLLSVQYGHRPIRRPSPPAHCIREEQPNSDDLELVYLQYARADTACSHSGTGSRSSPLYNIKVAYPGTREALGWNRERDVPAHRGGVGADCLAAHDGSLRELSTEVERHGPELFGQSCGGDKMMNLSVMGQKVLTIIL